MPRYRLSALVFLPQIVGLVGLLGLVASGCLNNTGITCPEDNPECDVPDMATVVPDMEPDLPACLARCTSGCCDDKAVCVLQRSKDACGVGGRHCMQCDQNVADRCSNEGKCVCGTTGGPCGAGQRCDASKGICICDEKSCGNGCCKPGAPVCHSPVDVFYCAKPGGGTCMSCNPNPNIPVADGCKDGCSCGGGQACQLGQVCVQGVCKCNATSCPKGCCNGDQCVIALSASTCAPAGQQCGSCPTSDYQCIPGKGCSCGTVGLCQQGQFCDKASGTCKCGPTSCQGCCSLGFCKVGNTGPACGIGGVECISCVNPTPNCLQGFCKP